MSRANYKGFRSLEEAEQFLRRAGVQCTWADFDQSHLNSLCKDGSSADSVSDHPSLMLYFFPGLFFIIFSYFGSFMVVWGFGVGVLYWVFWCWVFS